MKRQQASSAVLGEDTANPLGVTANGKPTTQMFSSGSCCGAALGSTVVHLGEWTLRLGITTLILTPLLLYGKLFNVSQPQSSSPVKEGWSFLLHDVHNRFIHSTWYIVRHWTNVSSLPFIGQLAKWNKMACVKCLAYIKGYYPSPPKYFPWGSNLETSRKWEQGGPQENLCNLFSGSLPSSFMVPFFPLLPLSLLSPGTGRASPGTEELSGPLRQLLWRQAPCRLPPATCSPGEEGTSALQTTGATD